MKTINLLMTSSVALMAALVLSPASYAGKRDEGQSATKSSSEVVLPESQGQRHKQMHAARKAAAKRMKTRMMKEHGQHRSRQGRGAGKGGVQ